MKVSTHLAWLFAAALLGGVTTSAAGDDQTGTNVPPDGEAFEQAALDFLAWCGPCHGRDGDGTGPVAATLREPPPDLRGIRQRNQGKFPTEMVRQRIDGRNLPAAHGTAEMPIWGYWFRLQANAGGLLQEDINTAETEVQARIDRLVRFVETIQQ